MSYWLQLAIVILLIIVWLVSRGHTQDNFETRPSQADRQQLIDKILKNKHLFDPHTGSFSRAKAQLPNLDNVMYSRAQTLHGKNKFTAVALMQAIF